MFILGNQNYVNPCSTMPCEIAVSILKVILLFLSAVAIIWAIRSKIRQCRLGSPIEANSVFISKNPLKTVVLQDNPFVDGLWFSRYYQFNTWHLPQQLSLSFNRYTNQVSGGGIDEIGSYTIDGIFSMNTFRMALTKLYQAGTGDPTQNLGHAVIVQLIWDSKHNLFRGKWYIHTNKYRGEDKFELKLGSSTPLLATNPRD